MANGRCRMHGGSSTGAPAGNQNALKTGEHQTIFASTLDEEEAALFDTIDTDKLKQLDEQLRLIVIRERRMLQRIADLREVAFTTVRKRKQKKTEEKSRTSEDGLSKKVRHTVTVTDQEERGSLGQIQMIEEALTRVQARHIQLLTLKQQIESGDPPEDDQDLSGFSEALNQSAEGLPWPQKPAGA